jgi:hypothetical protein
MTKQDTWTEYDEKIKHWRPQFGNAQHIHARDVIADINRKMPLYEAALADYKKRSSDSDRKRIPSKRLEKIRDELTKMKQLVLSLIAV